MRIQNQICLITGAARGIGLNIAYKLASTDAIVCIADIDEREGLRAVAEIHDLGFRADFFYTDLSCKGAPNQLVEEVINKYKKIDVIVNNARGRSPIISGKETEESWDLVFDVGLRSAYFLSVSAIPFMGNNSSIINIGSVSGTLVSNESAAYQISKGAVGQLTRYLANFAGRMGIRVNEVSPGFIVQDEHIERYSRSDEGQNHYRDLVKRLHPLRGGAGRSENIADAVLFLISEKANFITGHTLVIDGGLSSQDPTKVLFDHEFIKSRE